MNQIDEENLSVAIQVGTAVCNGLGICCRERGRVIFQIYEKLEQLKSLKPITAERGNVPESSQTEAEKPNGVQVNQVAFPDTGSKDND